MGNRVEALEIYRDLARFPETRTRAYEGAVRVTVLVEDWEELERIVRDWLAAEGDDPEKQLVLGQSLAHQGRRSEARKAWEKAVELSRDRGGVLERVARYAQSTGMIEEAVASLLAARKARGIDAIYAPDLATLYLGQKKLERATDEWLRWLDAYPKEEGTVRAELRRILWDSAHRDEARRILFDAVRDRPRWASLYRIVLGLWVELGWCREALELLGVVRQPGDLPSVSLVALGEECWRGGCPEAALELYRLAADLTPRERGQALIQLGRLLTELGRDREAAQPFARFLDEFPARPETAEVRYSLGRALLRAGRPGEALVHLRALIQSSPRGPMSVEARFLVAEGLIGLGRLDEAVAEIREIDLGSLEPADEGLLYRRGEILFLAAQFDDALESFRGVIQRFPKGRFVNDALSRVLLIGENRLGGEDALCLYASALYSRHLGHWPQALATLDSLVAAFPGGALTDEALLAKAEIDREAGNPGRAVRSLDRLLSEHPGSRHAPEASVLKGTLYMEDLGDPAAARETYEAFLMMYPESPLLDGVRRRLRSIEEAVP